MKKELTTDQLIGELITYERYTFVDKSLLADIVREVVYLQLTNIDGLRRVK
jgi:hypothetical protein